MAVISELEIRLSAQIARLQQDMDSARRTVDTAMTRISASVNGAMKAFAGLAAGLTVAAFAHFVKGGIDAADSMDELREKTGLLAQDIAGVRLIFQREGFGDQELTVSMSKLSKAITAGGGGLGALKIATKDASGEFRNTKDVLYDVADQFAGMDNGAQKSALAMEIFGKSGVALIPMLNGGSQGMRDMAEMAEKLGLVMSQETLTAAGDFNDTLFLIGQGSQGVAQGIAAELLPTLNGLAGSFLTSMTSGDKLASTAKVLAAGLKILYTVGVGIVEVFSTVGKALGAAAAEIVAFATGNFKEAMAIDKAARSDIVDGWKSAGSAIADAWTGAGGDSVAAMAKASKASKDLLSEQAERDAAAKKSAAEYAAAVKAATDFAAAMRVEASQVGLSTDQVKMMSAARAAAKAPTAALRLEIMEAALALDIATKAQAEKVESEKEVIESNKRAAEGLVAYTAIQKAQAEQVAKSIQAANDEVAKNEELITTFGLTKAAIEQLELARLQEQLAQRSTTGMTYDEIAALELLIEAKTRNVAATSRLGELQDVQKDADSLKSFLDEDKAQSFGDALRDAFNGAGSAIARMSNALRDFGKLLKETETRRGQAANEYMKGLSTEAEYTEKLIAIDKKQANEKLGSYGDMAGAAASFFDKQSGGYKALTGVSEAFHLAQLAMNLASIGPALAAGAAQMFAESGWGGFAGVAAMLGVMAALGASTGGGGGASSKDRQESAGTGSVLGDSSAKSESLANSIELAAANSSIELTHTAGMLASLKAIESSIGGLGSLLVRGTDVTSLADSVMPTSSGGFWGGLVSSIFGGKTTVQDTGVMIGAGTVGGIAQNGLVSQSYVDTKKSGGWFSSDKYNTATKALGAEVDAQFAKVILSLSDSVKTAAELLGVGGDAFTQNLNSFVVDLGKISLKDLNGEEIQDALETIFSKLGDDMAQFGVAGLGDFQKVGEGYFETLTRVATNYANLNSIMESIGSTFGSTGMASIAARERLIELTGGIDQLASQTSSFASNFLSQAEQLAPVQKYVTDALAAMGLQGVDTRDKFKDAVLGLANSGALATEAGAKQYTALLALADAFAKTHAATVDLSRTEQDIADERKDLQSQYDQLAMTSAQLREKERAGIAASNLALYDSIIALKDQAKAAELLKDKATDLLADVDGAFAVLQRLVEDQKAANAKAHEIEMKSIQKRIDAQTASITKLKSLSDSLKSSLDQMAMSGTGADGGRAAAQAQIAAALAIAKAGGPLPAADALKSALSVVTKDASDQFATYDEYLADFYKTQNSIAALGRVTDSALTVEQKTLDLLQAQKDANQAAYEAETERLNELVESTRTQIDVLKGVDTSLLTIDQTLQAVLGAIRDAKDNSIIAANAGIAKSYQEGLGRTPDKAGLEYWQQQAVAGMSPDAIDSLIKGSDEAQVQKLYKDLLGRNADAGGLNYWLKVMQSGSSIDDVKAAIKADAEYQKLNGVPGFAAGGSFAGGMRLVGERGPEWEVTGPSRIFNADQTAAMLRQFSNPSDNSAALLVELRAQRAENADLRQMLESHLYAIAKSTLNAADTLEAVANGDLTFSTEEAE